MCVSDCKKLSQSRMIQIEILDQGLACLVENLAAVNAEVVVMPVREGEDFDRAIDEIGAKYGL